MTPSMLVTGGTDTGHTTRPKPATIFRGKIKLDSTHIHCLTGPRPLGTPNVAIFRLTNRAFGIIERVPRHIHLKKFMLLLLIIISHMPLNLHTILPRIWITTKFQDLRARRTPITTLRRPQHRNQMLLLLLLV
jgi:hypothetical protein